MKKNFYLLGLLSALLLGTYYFQELRSNRALEESIAKDHLISADKINSLKFQNVEAKKKEDQWWAQDHLLSHNSFKKITSKLSQIKKIKDISGAKENYFSKSLSVEVNGQKWEIGDLTLDRQGFYLSQDNKLMIAVMEGESQELVDDPSKIVEAKLEELKNILNQNLESLFETQLFRFYPKLPLGRVTIEADGRPSYELNLLENKTLPPPINGIEVHENILEKFSSLLTQMTIKRAVKFDEKLKFIKVAQMNFQNKDNKVHWELWLTSDNSADSYLVDNKNKKAWLMIGGTLKAFFIHVQDYWDKKNIPPSKFKLFTRLPVKLIQGNKSAEVEIINREPLAFEASNLKINQTKLNILFQYVFNLSEKDQADRISPLSKSERKQILSEDHLRVEVMDQELLFWRKQDEVIVVNLTQGFKAHFLVNDQSFRPSFEDVVK